MDNSVSRLDSPEFSIRRYNCFRGMPAKGKAENMLERLKREIAKNGDKAAVIPIHRL
jgi:hypothetical protein